MDLFSISMNVSRSMICMIQCFCSSANIGVFICLKCSGVHRSLGTHISKVILTFLKTKTQLAFLFSLHTSETNIITSLKLSMLYHQKRFTNVAGSEVFLSICELC